METPPLTWGRLRPVMREAAAIRNTPTHVGKTSPFPAEDLTRQKHPHSRGEDSLGTILRDAAKETPPLTWGRLSFTFISDDSARNTPTHVGKTGRNTKIDISRWKHPHSRGEDQIPF